MNEKKIKEILAFRRAPITFLGDLGYAQGSARVLG